MTEIHVIDLLDATHNGPAAVGPSGEEQEVHLQQGSLDGACGPYSLLMCLLICGLIERSVIRSLNFLWVFLLSEIKESSFHLISLNCGPHILQTTNTF